MEAEGREEKKVVVLDVGWKEMYRSDACEGWGGGGFAVEHCVDPGSDLSDVEYRKGREEVRAGEVCALRYLQEATCLVNEKQACTGSSVFCKWNSCGNTQEGGPESIG